MFGSIYTGLSGLLSFSKGLDVISNNVSNMNTPGFKSATMQFNDLFYKQAFAGTSDNELDHAQVGAGVKANNTSLEFRQGELRETGNDTDAAIDGDGFFVLQNGDSYRYSRAGQFQIDSTGHLISSISQTKVMGLAGGALETIFIGNSNSNPPSPTTKLSFTDILSSGDDAHELDDINIYDSTGAQQTWKVKFTNQNAVTPRGWKVEVFNSAGLTLGTGELRFNGDGSLAAGYESLAVEYTNEGGQADRVNLIFGPDNGATGVKMYSAGSTSSLRLLASDGYGVGALTDLGFDDDGRVTLNYSNGQSVKGPQLAVAFVQNPQTLIQHGESSFELPEGEKIDIGVAGTGGRGKIVGGRIELSNVELTQQFTDLIITQRGYQAASQILTVANEMMQELLNAQSGR